jgi:hypothetical protein
LLDETERDPQLMNKLVRKGCKLFPRVAVFHWWTVQASLERGPSFGNPENVLGRLRHVIRLAAKSEDPRDRDLAKEARRLIGLFESFGF